MKQKLLQFASMLPFVEISRCHQDVHHFTWTAEQAIHQLFDILFHLVGLKASSKTNWQEYAGIGMDRMILRHHCHMKLTCCLGGCLPVVLSNC